MAANKTTCHWPRRRAPPSANKTVCELAVELSVNCASVMIEATSNQKPLSVHGPRSQARELYVNRVVTCIPAHARCRAFLKGLLGRVEDLGLFFFVC